MTRVIKQFLGLALMLGAAGAVQAFSLIGQFPAWQTASYGGVNIGYNFAGDIGGPQTPIEGYRWNLPVLHYAFDQTFVYYFGSNGIAAVEAAIKILNDLPPVQRITNDASSLYINGQRIPYDTKRRNYEAAALGLLDLKSTALCLLVEEMGLAEPERYVWTLAGRNTVGTPPITNYTVFQRNYDPITIQPSRYVNGILYSYYIEEFQNPNVAEAIEYWIDPMATFPVSSVAGGINYLDVGDFFTGLTHDDVGGLRWLYNTNRLAVENLSSNNITAGSPFGGGSPWMPYFQVTNGFNQGTNFVLGTNTLVSQALRPGLTKLNFQRVNYDSIVGQTFAPVTNMYTDVMISNSTVVLQPVQRVITRPDIIFTAERLGLVGGLVPGLGRRTDTTGWQNNDAINGQDVETDGGPGVIEPTVIISFSDQLPYWGNSTGGYFLTTVTGSYLGITGGGPYGLGDESTATRSMIWGSFDATTNAPIIYPAYGNLTVQDLRQMALQGGAQ